MMINYDKLCKSSCNELSQKKNAVGRFFDMKNINSKKIFGGNLPPNKSWTLAKWASTVPHEGHH